MSVALAVGGDLDGFEQGQIRQWELPVSSAFDDESPVFGAGARNIFLDGCDIDQGGKGLLAVFGRVDREDLAPIAILKAV